MHRTTNIMALVVVTAFLASGCILGPQPEPPEVGDGDDELEPRDDGRFAGEGDWDCEDDGDLAGGCEPRDDGDGLCDGDENREPPGDSGYDDRGIPPHERVLSPFEVEDLTDTAGIAPDSSFDGAAGEDGDGEDDDDDDDDLWVGVS